MHIATHGTLHTTAAMALCIFMFSNFENICGKLPLTSSFCEYLKTQTSLAMTSVEAEQTVLVTLEYEIIDISLNLYEYTN